MADRRQISCGKQLATAKPPSVLYGMQRCQIPRGRKNIEFTVVRRGFSEGRTEMEYNPRRRSQR